MKWMMVSWALMNPMYEGRVMVFEYDNVLFNTIGECEAAKRIMIVSDPDPDNAWLCVNYDAQIQDKARSLTVSK